VKEQASALLRLQWSPEQVASRLPVSHETLYQHVYADKTQGVVDVNYPDRSATTILAGGSGE